MRQAILLPALLGLTLLSGCGGPGGEAGIRESGKSGSATVAASYIPLANILTKYAIIVETFRDLVNW